METRCHTRSLRKILPRSLAMLQTVLCQVCNYLHKNVTYTPKTNANSQFFVPYNAVVEILLLNSDTKDHPFHMHGTALWVVATSANPGTEQLYANNYLVRDVVSLPTGTPDPLNPDGPASVMGWAKLRFLAYNPGTWLFHCHIQWHIDAGLAAIMISGPDHILPANTWRTANKHVRSSSTIGVWHNGNAMNSHPIP